MPEFRTKYFNVVGYDEDSVLTFPAGLPGFDQERRFLPIEQPINKPLVFLQSLSHRELCFLALPVLTVDAAYRLNISPEDLRILGLPDDRQPVIGQQVACLAIVSLPENQSPTANLLSPVVIHLANRRAVQAIQVDSSYSHRHPLLSVAEAVCS
ncbi:MAG: flagellar assembly protein FliW [Acidobacteria bacterium]|nr:flagellar assembly protein FliW [Acidobacteriota bacterium]